jgi:hypothetical protein
MERLATIDGITHINKNQKKVVDKLEKRLNINKSRLTHTPK